MKQNVALFIEALSTRKDLNEEIAKASPTVAAWTQVAAKAGFQFSDGDLYLVLQKLLDKTVPAETVIPEFLAAQSELDTEQLDQVAGGSSRATSAVAISTVMVQRVRSLGGLGQGAAAWGMHVRGPFSSMPGGGGAQM